MMVRFLACRAVAVDAAACLFGARRVCATLAALATLGLGLVAAGAATGRAAGAPAVAVAGSLAGAAASKAGTPAVPQAATPPGGTVATAATAAAAALTPAVPGVGSGEQVEVDLPQHIAFEVTDLAGGAVSALSPAPIAFRGARLAPGRALHISVRLDTPLPPGAVVSFRGRNAQGGTCRSAGLSAATFTEIFAGTGSASAGGCQLAWTLACGSRVHRAGRYALTLRWRLESTLSDRAAALAAAGASQAQPAALAAPSPPAPARIPVAATSRDGAAGFTVPWLKPPS